MSIHRPETASPAVPATTTPRPNTRRIPRKVIEATEVLLDGRAKNLTQAAQLIGCSREYLSKTLSKRPDAVQYMKQRAARVLGVASTVAAARMASLIHAGSEHVAFRASEHVLGVAGISPANQPQVSISLEMKAGWIINLAPENEEERRAIERQEKMINATISDEKQAGN